MPDLTRARQLAEAAAASLAMAEALDELGRPFDDRVRQAENALQASIDQLRCCEPARAPSSPVAAVLHG